MMVRYAMADFDSRNGSAKESTIEWREDSLDTALKRIEDAEGRKCGMFYFWDVAEKLPYPELQFDCVKNATREQFTHDPMARGVCVGYYKPQPVAGGCKSFHIEKEDERALKSRSHEQRKDGNYEVHRLWSKHE